MGKGSYGSVFVGMNQKTNQQVAVKTIPLSTFTNNSEKIIANIRNEIKNMQMLNHKNIVKLYDVKKYSKFN